MLCYTFLAQKLSCSACVEGHQDFHGITAAVISHGPPSLDVSLFVISAFHSVLLSLLLPCQYSTESGTGLGGMWWHSSVMTQTVHPHGHNRIQSERGAKSGIKVTEGHTWMSLRCWDILTKAFKY